MLNGKRKSYFGCDQSSVHHVWPQFYPRVQLDYKCEIFINVANLPPKDVCFYPRLLEIEDFFIESTKFLTENLFLFILDR